jgi:hypothetical protein
MTTLRPLTILLLLVCLMGFFIAAFWMGGRLVEAGNRSDHLSSQARFEFIEAALLVYYEEHGAFPPTQYQPVAGGPIHSWRILLVPSIAGRQSKYDFSQEWNSLNNLQALGRVPPSYGYFRIHGHSDIDIAHYLAIGDEDEWPSRKPLRSRLVTKGKDRFLLVEFPESEIHWMEPKY